MNETNYPLHPPEASADLAMLMLSIVKQQDNIRAEADPIMAAGNLVQNRIARSTMASLAVELRALASRLESIRVFAWTQLKEINKGAKS